MSEKIPFVDFSCSHAPLQDDFIQVFRDALTSGRFVGGPVVEEFEKEFATFCDVQFCVGVASGTDALLMALLAAGVGSGDSVLTVPNTFIATAEAICQAGATPEFVDVCSGTHNLDPELLRKYLESNCRVDKNTGRLRSKRTDEPVVAILPVHLYGQVADMDSILELAEKYDLRVVEDACQAHGAKYFSSRNNQWRTAGSMGLAAAFSFYPGKNLGAFGEGGALTTNSAELADKARMLRDHGQAEKYKHDVLGYNARLDAIQAGILRLKLRQLAGWNQDRRARASYYNELLGDLDEITLPVEPSWSEAAYHLYVIRCARRSDLMAQLSDSEIQTGLHYPIPIHLQKAYSDSGYGPGDFPVSEAASGEILSLPMFPGLQPEQQDRVAEAVKKAVRI